MSNLHIAQTSLVNNLSTSFLTGSLLLDGIITIFISSLVTAMFGFISFDNIKPYYRRLYRWLYRKHSFTIDYGYTKDDKGWSIDPDNKDNYEIIESIEHYLLNNNYICKDNKVSIKSSKIMYLPKDQIRLPEPYTDVYLQISNNNNNEKENIRIERKIVVTSRKNDKIKQFLNDCLDQWQVLEKEKHKGKKYFYTHFYDRSTILFNKYELKTRKTFDDLFFPEKEKLLTLLDKFDSGQLDSSKFSLLMYGPPGTGKTSVIKALANHMGRSICYVKLSNIRNFQDLFEIFFTSQMTTFHFRYKTYTVEPKEKIIVLEDIDVESNETHKRVDDKEDKEDDDAKVAKLGKDEDKILFKKSLNLSDILQVLDGVYENTDTMIVITTNNIEKLDAALIRPGRITMKLHMKEMTRPCAFDTIHKFFPESKLTNKFNIIEDYTITPAQLECFCLQANNLTDLYKMLEDYYKEKN